MFPLFNNINIILASPLEGFKSYTYTFIFDSLVDNNWSTESLISDFYISNDYITAETGLFTGIILFLTFVLIVRFYLNSSDNVSEDDKSKFSLFSSKEFLAAVFFVPVLFLLTTFNSVNHFYQIIYDATNKTINTVYFEEHTIFISFLKDIWAFIVIFLTVSLFSSKSFSNLRLFSLRPLDSFGEALYKFSLGLFVDTLDIKHNHDVKNFQGFFIKIHAILLFVLGSNLTGMVPYGVTITSSLMNTLFLSLLLNINIIYNIINEKGVNYFFSIFMPSGSPLPLSLILVPIELISYLSRIISLAVRLFANMMAGHTLLKVIGGFSWSLMTTGDSAILLHYLPFAVLFILTFLEIGVAFIQAYIFVLLGYIILSDLFSSH